MNVRVRQLNQAPPRAGARYVLYWMQMNRRAESNHALECAAAQANHLGLPLFVYEGLTCTYPYANDRFHSFILEGVPATQAALAGRGIGYGFYLRRRPSDPNDLLYRVAAHAAVLVTGDYPTFVAARHNASVPAKIGIPYYAVDSSCIVPMHLHEKKEYGAHTIRPKIKRLLGDWLHPVERVPVEHRWNSARPGWQIEVTGKNIPALCASCDIDHAVRPSLTFRGGCGEARRHLGHFLKNNLKQYEANRNNPSDHATSNLSPYLHFGHISVHEVALAVQLAAIENGLDAESFLEELIVRRELAFNHALWATEPGSLDSIPQWAKQTLREHAADPRDPT